MTSCYIIDDEDAAISLLSKFIDKTPDLTLVGASINPLEALQKILNKEVQVDITFLDINMPEISGLELANLIGKSTHIIFTSAYTQYGLEAFDRDAIDYIAKPFSYERFLRAVARYIKWKQHKVQVPQKKQRFFFIKNDVKGKLTRVLVDEIIYIESLANYIVIHTGTEKHITYLTLTEAEEYLASYTFVRVHKSTMVNPLNIKAIEGNKLIMANDITITIGSSYRKTLSEKLGGSLLVSKRRN
ncbi:response regulator transcription factor [Olivibacter sp. SDN3]|uniref:LytR/AlgR family response regulator transcription factor n=1 Tax=Olivibacter sp. SDN3 TaxID=2764720 RepID=UPI001651952B|nr:LytTR family DNA-binding domain-containing protein [Olivibacter sp. SDN3]QNL51099.1 response regulator transcription factor [Olivibacter sp. SDN3]